jgi:exonuclease VII large subunit
MITITLTPEQQQDIAKFFILDRRKEMAQVTRNNDALKRRTDRRVDRANQRAQSWKVRYSEARKLLLAAQADIATLRRRLRNAEWEDE